ncbi:unnamed protein product [Cyberlindnera jadinii]|uniref:Cytochrome c oxidase-assembly factor COX23, mitochondrial n=2 Tax=Cyberlindnera jadinii (strain ATCC 18201 / CBS 1600 / BCRC 20928 / JCM 3617 / NBRC 0987 / NRRL Y-1542) TaxID=983966 RepID=A0A0H5C702_CYBJN|nr:unnamed protein product [Cyberlindnera jadinii]
MSEKTEDRKCDADFKVSAPDVTQDKDKVDFTKGSVDEFKYYPDNPTSNFHKAKFAAKGPSRYYDPCQESANMSIKCLESNNYDREMCYEYFKAYRECKKEWLAHRRKENGGW